MRILLTSPRAPAALELARHFRNAGHDVFFSDRLRFAAGRFSRTVERSFTTPRPKERIDDFVRAINKIVIENRIELLVPTCEEVFFLAARQKDIRCRLLIDEFQKLNKIHNKWEFAQRGTNVYAQVPESFYLKSPEDLEAFHTRSEEFVFKPAYSRFASETLIRPNSNALAKAKSRISESRPWIAQRYISGKEISTYSVARDGQLVAHCSYRSFFRAGKGSGICFQAEDLPNVRAYVAQFVADWNYNGQVGFDFILDEVGQLWVIEGNPRATSGVHMFDIGQGLADAIVAENNGECVEADTCRSHMVGLAMLLFGLVDAAQRFQFGLYLHRLLISRDVLFRWYDPLPTLCLPLTMAELVWISLNERKSLQQASTFDIEWNGEEL